MGLFDGTPLQRPVTCERCGKPLTASAEVCLCPRNAAGRVTLPKDQPARVRREKRRGKWTTVLTGLDPQATDLDSLCATLKARFAAGGTVQRGEEPSIELQGDHRDRVIDHLKSLGYPAKAAGG
ncbi:MAG: translation initiation factor [Phycisphaeraceae bacterium]|nr:translation initiation factor [Phycisphaeraceae bacterium]MCW5753071.1 translation initiation factor [Phycisphaeraceae bacterium]